MSAVVYRTSICVLVGSVCIQLVPLDWEPTSKTAATPKTPTSRALSPTSLLTSVSSSCVRAPTTPLLSRWPWEGSHVKTPLRRLGSVPSYPSRPHCVQTCPRVLCSMWRTEPVRWQDWTDWGRGKEEKQAQTWWIWNWAPLWQREHVWLCSLNGFLRSASY